VISSSCISTIDWGFTSEVIRNWAISFSAIVATITFVFNVWEKNKENRLNRLETYLSFEKRFNEQSSFQRFITLLEEDNPDLSNEDTLEKYKFLGFLEEISIAVDNKLLSRELAFYMFGYYAIRAKESEHFNTLKEDGKIKWDSVYWRVAKKFVDDMKKVEDKFASKASLGKIRV